LYLSKDSTITTTSSSSSSIKSKISLPLGTKRELASSFFQLKLGHGYNKSYLYRIGLVTNDKCKCGALETPIHLILYCKEYKEERKSLIEGLKELTSRKVKTLPILLNTKKGIESILVFLKETKISTRTWHIGRIEDIEDLEDSDIEDLGVDLNLSYSPSTL
jgi:hypothetical protein